MKSNEINMTITFRKRSFKCLNVMTLEKIHNLRHKLGKLNVKIV